ncbi:MAG: sensor histidine kinase [Armatimonadota bacterium]
MSQNALLREQSDAGRPMNGPSSTIRLWPAVVVLAVIAMVLLQWLLHEFFMRLPMLQYHLVSALVNAVVVSVTAILYIQWRRTAVTAHEALRQLRASEALRDDLTSMLVHDFKNPLTVSLMWSKMLLERSQTLTAAERDMLHMAVRAQKRLVSMVEDLLDVARAEEGMLPIKLGENDLAEIIQNAASEAALPVEQAGVQLSVELAACPPVISDADKLRRVVDNLLTNAIKFTPKGGRVSVSLNCTDTDAVVSVRDTGQGFPLGSHERIFDKFTQGSSDGPRLSVGLGLTFCKFAIEAQGGRIWAESTPGKGSTFTFSLPLTRQPQSEDAPSASKR